MLLPACLLLFLLLLLLCCCRCCAAPLVLTQLTHTPPALRAVDDAELERFRVMAEKRVVNFVNLMPPLAVVGCLLIGATHQNTIGRPKPWHVSEHTLSVWDATLAEALLWFVYFLNVLVEVLGACVLVSVFWCAARRGAALPAPRAA